LEAEKLAEKENIEREEYGVDYWEAEDWTVTYTGNDHAYIQGENRWRIYTGRKHDPSYIQGEKQKTPYTEKSFNTHRVEEVVVYHK